jgi:TonB C terminal
MSKAKKLNSSKFNLVVSVIFHTLLVLVLFYFAAKEGILGKKMQTLAVTMVPKDKKPEPPKEKAPEPKVETAKAAEAPRPANAPAPKLETTTAPPPSDMSPAAAPAMVIGSDMDFSDGAHEVAAADPNTVYKKMVERILQSRWNRPEGLADETFVAEAELHVDNAGQFGPYQWIRGSGNKTWDDSVKAVLSATKTVNHAPPKGFPGKFTVRFDIETSRTEEVIQISSR